MRKQKSTSNVIDLKDFHPKMNGTQLQKLWIDLLHAYGYRVCHFRPARVLRNGVEVWETPFTDDGRGFVDIVAAKSERKMIMLEIKRQYEKLSLEQEIWGEILSRSSGVFYMVVRPKTYEVFEKYIIENNS